MNSLHIVYEDGSRRIVKLSDKFLYSRKGNHRLDRHQLHKKAMNVSYNEPVDVKHAVLKAVSTDE